MFSLVLILALGGPMTKISQPQERFLSALCEVESGNKTNVPDGDGGKAIGPFQIHKVYWLDACKQNPSLKARGYEACREKEYAKSVVVAYFSKYAPEAWRTNQFKTLARIHNGGPRGEQKAATLPYWDKVCKVLEKSSKP